MDSIPQSLGSLVISIDTELLWGVHDRLTDQAIELCRARERVIAHRLIKLLDRYQIPATWAFVSRMFDPAQSTDDLPEKGRGGRECWEGDDIVDAVLSAAVQHDIGSHSHSHLAFDKATRIEAEGEMSRARAAHDRRKLPFASFVFPRNGVAHVDVIAAHGVRVFRSHDAGMIEVARRYAPRLHSGVNLGTKILPTAPPTVLPIRRQFGKYAVVELPSSLLLLGRNGFRRVVAPKVMARKMRRGLDAAARDNRVFHLWFHPSNFYFDMETQLQVLQDCLTYATHLRGLGLIETRTMAEFAPVSH